MKELCVDKNYRRLGIAKSLMNELMKRAKDREYKKVILTTSKNQFGAQKLYENLGFQFTGDAHLGILSDFLTGINVVHYSYEIK